MKTSPVESMPSKRVEKKEVVQEAGLLRDISIWIDNYDDIFSDFDPRSFSERNISDDFLSEVRKVSRESEFHVRELRLLIPEKSRNAEAEAIIIRRLHTFFRKHFQALQGQNRQKSKKGVLLAVSGIIMMVGAGYVSSVKSGNLLLHALFVLLEPTGWFMAWSGLDNLINLRKEQKPELDFYKKMSRSRIVFVSI